MIKTLKGKISLVYIGLVSLTALVGCISALNMLSVQKSVDGLMTDNYISISAMEGSRAALNEQEYDILQYLKLNDTSGINHYYVQEERFQAAFQRERNDVTEQGEQKLVNTVISDYQKFENEFSVFQSTRDKSGAQKASNYYKSTLKPQINKLNGELNQITILNQNAMFRKKNKASGDARMSLIIILIITVTTVTAGAILSRILANRFLLPIYLLTENISKVRAGKLDVKLDLKSGDETEKLIHEFNEMINRLSAFEKSTMGTLMEEKNKSVAIVKSISDPLLVLNNDFKIVMSNDACEKFFGFDEEQVLGEHFLEAIRNGDLFNYIKNCMESPDALYEKILYFEKDNGLYFNVAVTKYRDPEKNHVKGCIMLMQNVTEFKELERTKTNFVATVSHEFKTPLTSIIMGASMLEGGNLGTLNEEELGVVKAIIEDGERLSGYVSELLEVSKLESGNAVYSFEPCSFSAITEGSVRQFVDTAERENVTIINDVDENLPAIYVDSEKIAWVLNNLLSNALKYTKSGDTITILAIQNGDFLDASVEDTGDGIPPEYLERIFDQFVQVKGTDVEVRGSGLGLAVAKEIIRANGGSISVESEMDAGSTFHFTLPLFKSRSNI